MNVDDPELPNDAVLCPHCVSDLPIGEEFDTIRATEHKAVDYRGGLVSVRRGGAVIIVAPSEVRRLVDALGKAGVRMAELQAQDTGSRSPNYFPCACRIASKRFR